MRNSEIDRLLQEISAIIALIGSYDEGNGQLTMEGRRRLHRLFELKMQLASALHENNRRVNVAQENAIRKTG